MRSVRGCAGQTSTARTNAIAIPLSVKSALPPKWHSAVSYSTDGNRFHCRKYNAKLRLRLMRFPVAELGTDACSKMFTTRESRRLLGSIECGVRNRHANADLGRIARQQLH